jgi:acetyltransferase-like isoleucine patch superfamily enzyme
MGNPFDTGYYTEDDLCDAGFRSLGRNVRIAKNCTIVGVENISIGNQVRIDCNCTILAAGTGWVTLGSFIHIGSYVYLGGKDGIMVADFCALSQRVSIYSRSDDYSGKRLIAPMVPEKFTGGVGGKVQLQRHVVVGSGSVILPGVTVGEGSSVGALSLVNRNLPEWGVYFGCPARKVENRSKDLLDLEKRFLEEFGHATPAPLS